MISPPELASASIPQASFPLAIENVFHRYGELNALNGLSLSISQPEIVGILGPNGSGKSTLFKLISTLVRVQEGTIRVFGNDTNLATNQVRSKIGIVFQSPSLDKKLTVRENIQCQAALVGLHGSNRDQRIVEVMNEMGIEDRANDRCEKLSGGLKRRVEIAKGILHHPPLLLLDEPSTGLDPAARLDLWNSLTTLHKKHGVTVLLTTHLLEEAEKCGSLAILHEGKCVAFDAPDLLRKQAGNEILTIQCADTAAVADKLQREFQWNTRIVGNSVRMPVDHASEQVIHVSKLLGESIQSLTIARPSLEDVFIAKTGTEFFNGSRPT